VAELSGAAIPVFRRTNLALVNNMKDKETEKKIIDILAAQLKKHHQIHVNGLGTFTVEHKKQNQHQESDGRIVMTPPADIIAFTPEQ